MTYFCANIDISKQPTIDGVYLPKMWQRWATAERDLAHFVQKSRP